MKERTSLVAYLYRFTVLVPAHEGEDLFGGVTLVEHTVKLDVIPE